MFRHLFVQIFEDAGIAIIITSFQWEESGLDTLRSLYTSSDSIQTFLIVHEIIMTHILGEDSSQNVGIPGGFDTSSDMWFITSIAVDARCNDVDDLMSIIINLLRDFHDNDFVHTYWILF